MADLASFTPTNNKARMNLARSGHSRPKCRLCDESFLMGQDAQPTVFATVNGLPGRYHTKCVEAHNG